ncbi:response regulator [Paenibacillus sp. JCM 10914]|uniref:response regulator n=1 Tax=Paenibacillus sp. JCM 10914 TaxID=1236974 RepID=UPI0003CCB161|nr:response regulator [Paenibacillus sp. JCM 10914]GAE08267.1 two-component response regulator TrxR [Paenibacillus sp. JCM 10914]
MFNVLLVDDEPWVLEGLKTMVNWNRYGFQICGEALSAPEALRLIEELRPELVMTDIHMPVLNGLELIERSNRMLRKPPKFVVLSGYDDFGYAHEAMRQRVTEYLLKPIDDEEIEDMLSKLSSVIRDEHAAELTSRKRHQIAANYMMNLLLQGGDRTDVTEQACKALNIQPEEKLQCVLVRGVLMQEHLVEQLRYQFPEFICCFQDNRGEMAAVLRYDPSNQEELLEAANRLQHELSRAGEEAAIITISVGAQGMHALGERYRHAELSQPIR